jgi:DNA polymerase-3 subunit delta
MRRGNPAPAADPLARLERDALRSYYLLYGDETFLIDRAVALLRRRLVPEGRAGSWRGVWAGDEGDRLAAALADLASPSLFGGLQVLVIRRAEALREADEALITDALPTLGAGGCLVLVARAVDLRRKLVASCQRAGAAYAFPPPDRAALAGWIPKLAREAGRDIAAAAADELLERVGPDLALLAGEIEKLALHAPAGAKLGVEHVRALVAAVRAHGVEELTDRLAHRDLQGAARTLRSLLAEGEPPIKLVAFLAANLRRALHVAELAEAGLPPETIATRLGMPPWLVQKQLRRGPARALINALVSLAELDEALKQSRPNEAVFDAALLRIAIPSR